MPKSSSKPFNRVGRALVFALLLVVAVPLPARAEAWAGTRYCQSYDSCKVRSHANMTVKHERCDTSFLSCVVKASWSNGGSYMWRTSWHGSGSQGVLIGNGTGSIQSQSATCVCVSQNCPV